ncbi:hypothetical protein [Pseudonocardia adelaidensis]
MMLDMTGWALVTWLKVTALLVAIVTGAWWFLGTQHGAFWLIVVGAVLAEGWTVRQLAREWGHEARFQWWWLR